MRILYFSTRECWPPTSGAHLRDYHLARQLALHHEVTYLGYDSTAQSASRAVMRVHQPELAGALTVLVPQRQGYAVADLARGLLGPQPISLLKFSSAPMRAELARLMSATRFDTVQLEGVHLSGYIQQIRAAAPNAAIICDWHNVESELMDRYADNSTRLAQRWYARRTATLLRRCEDLWLARGDAHTVCSERERLLLRQRAPQAHITVVGNGVDCAYLGAPPAAPPGEQAARQTVVFVGSMNYHANVDAALYFAAEIWPAVRRLRPELQFVIVGARPVAPIQALHGREGIVVTGTVPDVRPYYRDALAVVVPLRVGGGTRLKVLEAMAAGTPVISTTLGVEGLAVRAERELLIADTPAAFSELVAGMHGGDALWQRLSLGARQCVSTQYDWVIMGKALLAVHGEAAARRQRLPH